jgi:hypothetical protein
MGEEITVEDEIKNILNKCAPVIFYIPVHPFLSNSEAI